jgi:hypothetical protein
MKSFFVILLSGLVIGSMAVACSSSTPAPIVNTTPTVTTTPSTLDAGLDGSACGNFATENEQLLNAPTDSIAIKKPVNLPR